MKAKLVRYPLLATLAIAASVLVACGGSDNTSSASSGGGGGGGRVSLVAYSTPKEAYGALIPAFQKTAAGKGVEFTQSYGPSGDQARAVQSGLPADLVALSLAPDVDKLIDSGHVAKGWQAAPGNGFVTRSVVVFLVRKGNPKGIKTWDDLVKPGVQVIEPNPFASGGARWNVMAAYGAQLEQGRSEAQAEDYLSRLFKNVPVQDKSARDALQTFASGKGDVLLAYENEALTAKDKALPVEYVVPDQTILIENPVAVTAKSRNPTAAKAFLAFLHSDAGQRIFAEKGYRPVNDALVDRAKFPAPSGLFKIGKLGGWSAVNAKFFDPDKGVVAKIEKSLGVSTAK